MLTNVPEHEHVPACRFLLCMVCETCGRVHHGGGPQCLRCWLDERYPKYKGTRLADQEIQGRDRPLRIHRIKSPSGEGYFELFGLSWPKRKMSDVHRDIFDPTANLQAAVRYMQSRSQPPEYLYRHGWPNDDYDRRPWTASLRWWRSKLTRARTAAARWITSRQPSRR